VVGREADHREQHHDQDPAEPERPRLVDLDRGGRLEDLGRAHAARRPVLLVVLSDQRHRVDTDHGGDRADVPARVKVAAARREVALLDSPDDRFPDPGLLTHQRNRETPLTPRLRQGVTNAHTAPPGILTWNSYTDRTSSVT
jgi:hypothetical protein